jgi:hypothetical protein
MEKIEKNDFQIWIEICHENLKWKNLKFSFLKFENFHFWNLKWKFLFIFLKLAISPNGNEKTIEMKKSYIWFMPLR